VSPLRSLLLAGVIAACAPIETIEAKLGQLKGHPVQDVVQRLGAADGLAPAANGTAWVWQVRVRVPHAPITETTTSYATGFRSVGQTTGYSDVALPETCTLRVLADGAGLISSAEARGSNGACASMVHNLFDR
jgi:hypothetical protein